MRQYTLQLLLREDIFQNIDHIPDTMVRFFFEKVPLQRPILRIGLMVLLKLVFFLNIKIILVKKISVIMFKFVCLFVFYSFNKIESLISS
jgi:hypothetical protein